MNDLFKPEDIKVFNHHKWNMFRGFYNEPHHTAYCLRCKKKYKDE